MENHLIEKAKGIKYKTKQGRLITESEVELAIAWARGDITSMATSEVLNLPKGTNTYVFMAMALREFIKKIEPTEMETLMGKYLTQII